MTEMDKSYFLWVEALGGCLDLGKKIVNLIIGYKLSCIPLATLDCLYMSILCLLLMLSFSQTTLHARRF